MDSESMPEDDSKEFDDGYDENLMGDEEDRKHLASLTEKEREQELFNRSERRETLKIRYEIEKKLKSKAKRREQEKRTSRKRFRVSEVFTSDEESSESDEYTPEIDSHTIEASSKNTTKMSTRSAALNTSSSPSSDSASSESSSSESERENDDFEADEEDHRIQDDFQMSLNDLKSIQLKRDQVDKWVYAPFFKETAIGLFVKVSVSHNAQTNMPVYKVGQIMDITKGQKIYALNKNKTDKLCRIKIGSVERTYSMNFISNRSFDDDDYRIWKDSIHQDGQDMPSREHFNRKQRDLHKAIYYEYKDEDIAFEVAERSRYNDRFTNFALKKTQLLRDKAEAEGANDYKRAEELQKEVDLLEEEAKRLEKSRSSKTFSAISYVNERNRYKNIVESERVLKESKSVKTEDPFTRRKCTPTIVHNKNNDPTKSDANDKNGQDDLAKTNSTTANANSSNAATNNNNGNKSFNDSSIISTGKQQEGSESVDDLFKAHANIDLELDIDI